MNEQERFSGPEKSEKQKCWDEMVERVGKITDRLENPVDERIKEGVVALNALGINTTGSCEGHLDRGEAGPWIHIQAKLPKELKEEIRELAKDRELNRGRLRELSNEVELKNLKEQKKLFVHLESFYKGREVPFHRRLIIENVALGRLESQGVRLQKIEDEPTKRERLEEYQAEMDAFVAFPKYEFFELEEEK